MPGDIGVNQMKSFDKAMANMGKPAGDRLSEFFGLEGPDADRKLSQTIDHYQTGAKNLEEQKRPIPKANLGQMVYKVAGFDEYRIKNYPSERLELGTQTTAEKLDGDLQLVKAGEYPPPHVYEDRHGNIWVLIGGSYDHGGTTL